MFARDCRNDDHICSVAVGALVVTQLTFLEFDDADDPESNAHKSDEKTSFKLSVKPEMFLLALIKEPKMLAPDVLPAVHDLMYAAYLQGKRVGAL